MTSAAKVAAPYFNLVCYDESLPYGPHVIRFDTEADALDAAEFAERIGLCKGPHEVQKQFAGTSGRVCERCGELKRAADFPQNRNRLAHTICSDCRGVLVW